MNGKLQIYQFTLVLIILWTCLPFLSAEEVKEKTPSDVFIPKLLSNEKVDKESKYLYFYASDLPLKLVKLERELKINAIDVVMTTQVYSFVANKLPLALPELLGQQFVIKYKLRTDRITADDEHFYRIEGYLFDATKLKQKKVVKRQDIRPEDLVLEFRMVLYELIFGRDEFKRREKELREHSEKRIVELKKRAEKEQEFIAKKGQDISEKGRKEGALNAHFTPAAIAQQKKVEKVKGKEARKVKQNLYYLLVDGDTDRDLYDRQNGKAVKSTLAKIEKIKEEDTIIQVGGNYGEQEDGIKEGSAPWVLDQTFRFYLPLARQWIQVDDLILINTELYSYSGIGFNYHLLHEPKKNPWLLNADFRLIKFYGVDFSTIPISKYLLLSLERPSAIGKNTLGFSLLVESLFYANLNTLGRGLELNKHDIVWAIIPYRIPFKSNFGQQLSLSVGHSWLSTKNGDTREESGPSGWRAGVDYHHDFEKLIWKQTLYFDVEFERLLMKRKMTDKNATINRSGLFVNLGIKF